MRKIENKARSGGSVYATAFQAKWAVALRAMELPEGHHDKRADIGAGLLSPVAYGDFMKMFGKWLQTKVSYAPNGGVRAGCARGLSRPGAWRAADAAKACRWQVCAWAGEGTDRRG